MTFNVKHKVLGRIGGFCRNVSGGFVIQFALAAVPIVLLTGGAMDYVRLQNAISTAQTAADAAALAAAVAALDPDANLEEVAREAVTVNLQSTLARDATMTEFTFLPDENDITIKVEGDLPASFLGIINIPTLRYAANSSSTRQLEGSVEVALVLDNTWSMNGAKLTALKSASAHLVTTLTRWDEADVRIGVVPYADYVNVGLHNRDQPWVDVGPDYTETVDRPCRMVTHHEVCDMNDPQECIRYRDGIPEVYTCYPCWDEPLPEPYEVCPGPQTREIKWFGCVLSRTGGTLHLSDDQPGVPYQGFMNPRQQCPNPIVPLTASAQVVQDAIQGMVVSLPGYRPETYIPSGLVWGLNVLSPTAPFEEGQDYDDANHNPRKAMVLMTDGANTLWLHGNGQHRTNGSPAQINKTYEDQVAICANAKEKGIEIFSVAFEVADTQSLNAMLDCATSPQHYFNAADPAALFEAFDRIAKSLTSVRLTR